MTTNNLLSDRCTICALERPDEITIFDPIFDPRVCLCRYVTGSRNENCALALYRSTMKELDERFAAFERDAEKPYAEWTSQDCLDAANIELQRTEDKLTNMWQKCLHCGSYVSECQCSGGYGK